MENLEVDISELPFENTEEFEIMVVKPSNIESFDYNNPGYITNLINQDFTYQVKCTKENFFEKIAENLKIKEFHELDRNVTTHIVYDKPEYIYEIMFLEVVEESNKTNKNENQFGHLINTYGEKVYGNLIILKTCISNKKEKSMLLDNVSKDDLFEMLDSRVNTKVVIYEDGEYRQDIVRGDMDVFCKNLFEEDYYKTKETAFLKHNLNICYITGDLGNEIFPKITPGKIEMAVFYSMNNENFRGNITLDEVKKIVKLSNIMESSDPKSEWMEEETDSLGRRVIKNKYKILEFAWKEYNK